MSTAMNRTDFLAACNAADSRNKAMEEIRDKGADVILASFRMLKNSLVHAIDNNAVRKSIGESHAILTDFANIVGGYVAITFVDDTIFVCGQLLRASRSIYESALEVGKMLALVGVSELTFTGEVKEDDLFELCRHFSIATRDPQQRNALLEAKLKNVVVRKVDSQLTADDPTDSLPDMERTLHAYAAATVVMRQFLEKVAAGRTVLPHRVKRIAQKFVALAETSEMAMLAMTSLSNAHRDDAGRAVQTAILSVLLGRKLTKERTILSQLAMAALMADVGRVRIAGKDGLDRYVALGDEAEAAVPALTSSLFLVTGGVNLQNALRTVIAYEASQLERAHLLGPPYGRAMSTLFQSRVLHVARELLHRLAPRDGGRPLSPLDALSKLAGQKNIDQTAYKLLVKAVGLLPTGTVVEFETGEWGVVLGPSKNPVAVSKPRIRLVTDRQGEVFSKVRVIDLGESSGGRKYPAITGVIEPTKARFNITAMLVESEGDEPRSGTMQRPA